MPPKSSARSALHTSTTKSSRRIRPSGGNKQLRVREALDGAAELNEMDMLLFGALAIGRKRRPIWDALLVDCREHEFGESLSFLSWVVF